MSRCLTAELYGKDESGNVKKMKDFDLTKF